MSDNRLLLCYNRGCGKTYDPEKNSKDSCRHHSGVPVFHDAYKGWSCCNKKCTDFTEFLNIKGCTVTCHSNDKPPEPEKPKTNDIPDDVVIEYRPPEPERLERPPLDTPLVVLKPSVTDSLKQQLSLLKENPENQTSDTSLSTTEIPVGTACTNNACKTMYEGPFTLQTTCMHHPGYPVFHEGLKFWTCCNKKTTEFDNFLAQPGCSMGKHVWFKKKMDGEVKCRVDWFQTATHVYVSVFGKKCDPDASEVELSPIRLRMSLYYPEQRGAFTTDMELHGIVNVEKSSVSVTPAKVEVSLVKKEGGSWSRLDVPRNRPSIQPDEKPKASVSETASKLETVDLSDL